MDRIIEAFNTPYFEMTVIDSLIVAGVILAVFGIGYLFVVIVKDVVNSDSL